MKKLVTIVGPTAVGKTDVAIWLADYFGTEIVSADARQTFKELTIGTAKPTASQLNKVKHHFVSSHSIHDDFSAGKFGKEATRIILSLFDQYDNIILCGGSGLYVKAILEGFDEMPEVPDQVRKKVRDNYALKGLEWLQQEVSKVDPEYFTIVDSNNPQRLMRALEIYQASGMRQKDVRKRKKADLPFHLRIVGLTLDRTVLHKRIDARADEMIKAGLIEEVKDLLAFRNLNALQTVGYREVIGFLEGHHDQDEAIRLIKRNTRRYAKRQMTWFRKMEGIQWFDPEDKEGILKFVEERNGE